MDQVPGGFKVHLTKHGKDVTHVEVKVAYAIRRGDPFRKWCLDDFDPKTLKVEVHHGRLDAIQENRWIFEVTDPSEFWSSVIGLDEHRDVVTTTRFAP